MSRGLCLAWAAAMLLCGCGDRHGNSPPEQIAVSNSWLEAVTADVLGQRVPMLRLAEPGMCPGHVDLRPSQVSRLRGCRVLLKFDFQQGLESKLITQTGESLQIRAIAVPGGLCVPASYLSGCRQVAEALVQAGLLDQARATQRLAAIEQRLAAAEQRWRPRTGPPPGRPVLCSRHQQGFCEWLGLQVLATFSEADASSVSQIEQAIAAGSQSRPAAIIANQTEGRRLADALSGRLGAPVVVFANFPDPTAEHPFDALVAANIAAVSQVRNP